MYKKRPNGLHYAGFGGVVRTLLHYVKKAIRSENFLAAAIFAMSGLAFAAANVILARVQTVEDYAVFALVIALITLFGGFGLFGADGIVNRHKVRPDFALLSRILVTTAVAAAAAGIIATVYYDIEPLLAVLLCAAVVAQAAIYFCAAYFRSRQDFRAALLTFNSSNYVLLTVAIVTSIYGFQGALAPIAMVAATLVAVACASVINVLSKYSDTSSDYVYSWREAAAFISITGSASILIQLERLVTPKLLTLEDLATLGILLALVGPPYRLLQLSLGYVLLPKLRNARDSLEKNSLIVREIVIALSLLVPCWLVTWYLVPVLDRLFFGDKYPLSEDLILAVIVSGTAKALSGLAVASVAGLVSARHLEITGFVSWIGVGVAVVGAYVGSGFGLAGIVYGVSAGWFLRIIVAAVMVSMHKDADLEDAPPVPQSDRPLP